MLNTKNKILRPSGRKLCLFAILTILVTFGVNQGSVVKTTPAKPEVTKVEAKQLDPRAKVLANYFASKNSPFEYQAQDEWLLTMRGKLYCQVYWHLDIPMVDLGPMLYSC